MALEKHRDELWRVEELKQKELEVLQDDLERLRTLSEEDRIRAEKLQQDARAREEDIINDLEERVKRTVQAKDGQIGEFRSRCVAAENKVREFEYLLARQREELLS